MIKKLISLLRISVCLGDTLVLKDKIIYNGTFIKFDDNEIMFKAFLSTNWFKELLIDIIDAQELKLYDVAIVIENGIIIPTNEEHIKSTSYDIKNNLKWGGGDIYLP